MTLQNHKTEKKDREDARTPTMIEQMPLKRPMSEPVTDPAGATGRPHPAAWRRPALVGVKAVHSLIYFSIESCMGYLLYTGLKGREDRRTGIAAGVVAAESLIFVGNGRRCPLTGLAETLGAESGSVTDIYLPSWLASNLFPIHLPLLALALWLHARNFLRRRTLAGGWVTLSGSGVGR